MERIRRGKRQVNKSRRFAIRVLLPGLSISLALVLSTGAQNEKQAQVQKREVFPRPTGPYAVGTHKYLWIDQKREEPFTKDPSDRRHLLVRVWYPAELDPHRAHEIITAYTLAFFDKYLRGQRSKLLEAPPVDFPKVTFRKNK